RPGIPPKPADSTHSPPASPTPGTPAGPQQADPVRVLRQAAAAYANLRSLRADFVQSQENPLLGKRTESRGTISQRRPDRFLMKFSQPAGDVVVSDGEYFWIYYPSVDRKQVLRTRAAAAGGLDLQAQFIGDPTRRFTYTHHGRDVVGGRTAEVFTLVPKEPAGYRALKVWLDQRDGLARQFELTNDNGVMQRFELSNLELNPVLSDALFRFVPPADARIVER
ncbi:MAG TPA: outer membrane lipoprotein carrier protein LolA, partial [Longimicrobiales bacterium]|nr:outer membrane lipoprotein carrier protein LolA [Longimicrobiales bacterium]